MIRVVLSPTIRSPSGSGSIPSRVCSFSLEELRTMKKSNAIERLDSGEIRVVNGSGFYGTHIEGYHYWYGASGFQNYIYGISSGLNCIPTVVVTDKRNKIVHSRYDFGVIPRQITLRDIVDLSTIKGATSYLGYDRKFRELLEIAQSPINFGHFSSYNI